jgi:trimethylamine:corrinoid methyltransferase-like protein
MRWGGSFVAPCPIAELEHLYEMHQVVERPFGLPLYVVSPLRMVGDSLETILHFASRLDGASVSSMPIMGATAPIHFAGAFVQAIAEAIGGSLLLSILLPGCPISFSIMAFPFDMARGGIVYGSPEQNLCDLLRLPVNAYYGRPNTGTRSIRTTAQVPGVQASAEKAASAVVGALAGSRHFSGAGMLSVDEVWSPEQLVIDREIADYAQRIRDGFEFSDRTLSLEAIADCTQVGEYMSHASTLENYRSVYWMPRLFRHSMLHEWQTRDGVDAWQEARLEVRRRIAAHEFELDAARRRELSRIYDRAQRTLCE